MKRRQAINWSTLSPDDIFSIYWKQNKLQLWYPEKFSPSSDKSDWAQLSPEYKDVYKKVLVRLTGLDTEQGGEGMNLIGVHEENLYAKAIMSFMNMMEQIHAQSYSNIFTSLIDDKKERDDLFKWYEESDIIQEIANIVVSSYRKLLTPTPSLVDKYMAKVHSVFLESFLFYSGFYFPIYLAGNQKMQASSEIIFAILKDEAIHGNLIGYTAQLDYQKMTQEERDFVDKETYRVLNELFDLEVEFTKEVYSQIGLVDDVIEFLKYNANKALNNLGREELYEDVNVNPIVLNGIDTETKTHDFFSLTGSYVVSTELVPVSDKDFKELESKLGFKIQ